MQLLVQRERKKRMDKKYYIGSLPPGTCQSIRQYIQERIDPISYDIAKNKCFNSTDKL